MNYTLKFFDFSLTDFIAIAKAQWGYDRERAVRSRAGKQAYKTRRSKNFKNYSVLTYKQPTNASNPNS